ncbi:hypothetical protein [Phnomibacter ginsenosidimutans]|uniref:hypothetical protein n=1 Tax=Phnomibacter ginsenosidimutans TaxID=2676868 RepID=UPI001FE94A04|nr:hypothetical protein [Phnomibacter ginsenosidimutans]
MVNLIMDKPVVTELIQHDMNVEAISKELDAILNDKGNIQRIKKDYEDLFALLAAGGNASATAATHILHLLKA